MAPTGYFLQKETKATKGGWTYGRWRVARSETTFVTFVNFCKKSFRGQSGVPVAPTGYFLQKETKATKADGLTVGGG